MMLVGNAPTEITSLLYYFKNSDPNNFILARVTGKRRREVDLVVPASYEVYSRNQKDVMIFDRELAKRKELFYTLDLKHRPKNFFRAFPIYDLDKM